MTYLLASTRRLGARGFALGVVLLSGCYDDPGGCAERPAAGSCDAAIPMFYFDGGEGRCLEFTWGGCGGNVPFETLEACRATCEDR